MRVLPQRAHAVRKGVYRSEPECDGAGYPADPEWTAMPRHSHVRMVRALVRYAEETA